MAYSESKGKGETKMQVNCNPFSLKENGKSLGSAASISIENPAVNSFSLKKSGKGLK